MKRNIILNLLILIIVICCGLAIYFVISHGVKLEKWTEPTEIPDREVKEELTQPAENKEEMTQPTENKEIKEKMLNKEKEEPSINREEIMTYVESHISSLVKEIAPEICASCGSFEVVRFGFTSDNDTYVEYNYNEEPGRILVHATAKDQNLNVSVLAYFKPGPDMWNLVKGKDTQFGKKIEFYEKDAQGNWVSIHKF